MTGLPYRIALAGALAAAHAGAMAAPSAPQPPLPEPAAPAPAAAEASAEPAAFTGEADRILAAAYDNATPGAAVIVMERGRIVYQSARGMADLGGQRPIGPDTVFRVGSIAKQFTAAIVLQLVAEGKVSLDDPLSRFFPDWPEPSARATVRQLLDHSSGVFDYSKIPGFLGSEESKRPHTTAELVALMRDRPASAAPGAAWEYNNGGYTLLGAIIEQVTGESWADAVDRRIARPLGLASLTDAVSAADLPASARFYGRDGDAFVPADGAHLSVAGAAGNLAMTIGDLARWTQALHHGQVVAPALYAEMIRPARLADGSTRPYGFGLRLQRLLGEPALVHGGAARGVDTDAIYLPARDLFVAVFANSDRLAIDASTVSRRLAAAALGRPFPHFAPVTLTADALEALTGTYTPAEGPPFRVFLADGHLRVGRSDDEHALLAASEDRFYFGPDDLVWMEFVRAPGEETALIVHRPEAAEPLRAVRTGAAPAPFAVPAEVLRGYTGTYTTEVPVLTVALDPAGRLTVANGDSAPIVLRALSATEFRADEGGFAVTFHPEGERTDRMTLTRGARKLNGVRKD